MGKSAEEANWEVRFKFVLDVEEKRGRDRRKREECCITTCRERTERE